MAKLLPGQWVWACHPQDSWLPCKVVNIAKRGTTVRTQNGKEFITDGAEEGSFKAVQESVLQGFHFDNMVQMEELFMGSIFHNLRMRHQKSFVYTSIANMLVSINPYKPVQGLYGPTMIELYRSRPRDSLPPHIYAVAAAAYNKLVSTPENQAINISGRLGSGKTEAAKLALEYFAESCTSKQDTSRVTNRVLLTSPLLHAFGNAATRTNNNSSRFGKWIEVNFDDDKFNIQSLKYTPYLLEKSRVVRKRESERNFHVFYYVLAGLSGEEKKKYHFKDISEYPILRTRMASDESADSRAMQDLRTSMTMLDVSADEQDGIMRVLSAVLRCGMVKLEADPNKPQRSKVTDSSSFAILAEVLGCDSKRLEELFTSREILVVNDTIVKPLNVKEAIASRDKFCQELYAGLFNWVVAKINKALRFSDVSNRFIGVLDMFGFENLKTNMFEQFLVNYANEKLHQGFNITIFEDEVSGYEGEGIKDVKVEYAGWKSTCVDMIERKPVGILSLMLEQARLAQGSDTNMLADMGKAFSKEECYIAPRSNQKIFTIVHYAGNVTYNVGGFRARNTDALSNTMLAALRDSSVNFVSNMFMTAPRSAPPLTTQTSGLTKGRAKAKFECVSANFQQDLAKLTARLNSTNQHFIKCISPNEQQRANSFGAEYVLIQLKNLAIIETAKIRQSGFPVRMPYKAFNHRYKEILPKKKQVIGDDRTGSTVILEELPKEMSDDVRLGKTKVFMRYNVRQLLEQMRNDQMEGSVCIAQALTRGWIVRSQYKVLKAAYKVLEQGLKQGHALGNEANEDDIKAAIDTLDEGIVRCTEQRLKPKKVATAQALRTALQQKLTSLKLLATAVQEKDTNALENALSIAAQNELSSDHPLAQEAKTALEELRDYETNIQEAVQSGDITKVERSLKEAFKLGRVDEGFNKRKSLSANIFEHKARVMLAEATRQYEAEGRLAAAKSTNNPSEIAAAIQEATLNNVKPEALDAATEYLAQLVKNSKLRLTLATAVELGEASMIEEALAECKSYPHCTPETLERCEAASVALAEIKTETNGPVNEVEAKLQYAELARDAKLLKAALAEADAQGYTGERVGAAKVLMAQIQKHDVALEGINKAIEGRSVPVLKKAIAKAFTAGLKGTEEVDQAIQTLSAVVIANNKLDEAMATGRLDDLDAAIQNTVGASPSYVRKANARHDYLVEKLTEDAKLEAAMQARNIEMLDSILGTEEGVEFEPLRIEARTLRNKLKQEQHPSQPGEEEEEEVWNDYNRSLYQLHMFPGLRSTEDYNVGNFTGKERPVLNYESEVIPRSLVTDLDSKPALAKAALNINKLIQGYMGDRHYSYPGSLGLQVVETAINHPGMAEEVYLQVAKQTRDHPSAENTLKGFHLLCFCADTFPLTDRLRPYYVNHLQELKDSLVDPDPCITQYIDYALTAFKKTRSLWAVEKSVDHKWRPELPDASEVLDLQFNLEDHVEEPKSQPEPEEQTQAADVQDVVPVENDDAQSRAQRGAISQLKLASKAKDMTALEQAIEDAMFVGLVESTCPELAEAQLVREQIVKNAKLRVDLASAMALKELSMMNEALEACKEYDQCSEETLELADKCRALMRSMQPGAEPKAVESSVDTRVKFALMSQDVNKLESAIEEASRQGMGKDSMVMRAKAMFESVNKEEASDIKVNEALARRVLDSIQSSIDASKRKNAQVQRAMRIFNKIAKANKTLTDAIASGDAKELEQAIDTSVGASPEVLQVAKAARKSISEGRTAPVQAEDQVKVELYDIPDSARTMYKGKRKSLQTINRVSRVNETAMQLQIATLAQDVPSLQNAIDEAVIAGVPATNKELETARLTRERLLKESALRGRLGAAMEADDLKMMETAVVEAQSTPILLEDTRVMVAAATQAVQERNIAPVAQSKEEAEEQLQVAYVKREPIMLQFAIKEAEQAGVGEDQLRAPRELAAKQTKEQTENRLEVAMARRDPIMLQYALTEAEKAGVDNEKLRSAHKLSDRLKQEYEVYSMLEKAIIARDVDKINEALALAKQYGLEDTDEVLRGARVHDAILKSATYEKASKGAERRALTKEAREAIESRDIGKLKKVLSDAERLQFKLGILADVARVLAFREEEERIMKLVDDYYAHQADPQALKDALAAWEDLKNKFPDQKPLDSSSDRIRKAIADWEARNKQDLMDEFRSTGQRWKPKEVRAAIREGVRLGLTTEELAPMRAKLVELDQGEDQSVIFSQLQTAVDAGPDSKEHALEVLLLDAEALLGSSMEAQDPGRVAVIGAAREMIHKKYSELAEQALVVKDEAAIRTLIPKLKQVEENELAKQLDGVLVKAGNLPSTYVDATQSVRTAESVQSKYKSSILRRINQRAGEERTKEATVLWANGLGVEEDELFEADGGVDLFDEAEADMREFKAPEIFDATESLRDLPEEELFIKLTAAVTTHDPDQLTRVLDTVALKQYAGKTTVLDAAHVARDEMLRNRKLRLALAAAMEAENPAMLVDAIGAADSYDKRTQSTTQLADAARAMLAELLAKDENDEKRNTKNLEEWIHLATLLHDVHSLRAAIDQASTIENFDTQEAVEFADLLDMRGQAEHVVEEGIGERDLFKIEEGLEQSKAAGAERSEFHLRGELARDVILGEGDHDEDYLEPSEDSDDDEASRTNRKLQEDLQNAIDNSVKVELKEAIKAADNYMYCDDDTNDLIRQARRALFELSEQQKSPKAEAQAKLKAAMESGDPDALRDTIKQAKKAGLTDADGLRSAVETYTTLENERLIKLKLDDATKKRDIERLDRYLDKANRRGMGTRVEVRKAARAREVIAGANQVLDKAADGDDLDALNQAIEDAKNFASPSNVEAAKSKRRKKERVLTEKGIKVRRRAKKRRTDLSFDFDNSWDYLFELERLRLGWESDQSAILEKNRVDGPSEYADPWTDYRASKYKIHTFPDLRIRRSMFGKTLKLKYEKNKLEKSLLATFDEDPELHHAALVCDKLVRSYLEEEKDVFRGDLGVQIVSMGLESAALRDEIFLQIAKMATLNPSPEFTIRGWHLLCFVTDTFPPNEMFRPYFINFLLDTQAHLDKPDPRMLQYLEYVLFAVRKTRALWFTNLKKDINWRPRILEPDEILEMEYVCPETPHAAQTNKFKF